MKRCMCNTCVRGRHESSRHYSPTAHDCLPGHNDYERPRRTFNDAEREQWIANDEGLYNWQRTSGMGMRQFIRENRAEIDHTIKAALG